MKWRELLGFFGCLLVGFACDRGGGSVASETGAQLCKSSTDCGAAESCDLDFGGSSGVCKPRGAAASGGSSSCTSDGQCANGWECEYEHGRGYCKPHHDDDKEPYEADGGDEKGGGPAYGSGGSPAHGSAGAPAYGSAGGPAYDSGVEEYPPCTSDSDCPAYQTCKYAEDKSGHGGGDDHGDNSGHGHGGDDYDDKAPAYPPRTGVCESRSGGDDDHHY